MDQTIYFDCLSGEINQSQLDISTNFDQSQGKLKKLAYNELCEKLTQKQGLKIKKQETEINDLKEQLAKANKYLKEAENFQIEQEQDNNFEDNTILLENQQIVDKQLVNSKFLQFLDIREQIQSDRDQELRKRDTEISKKYQDYYNKQIDDLKAKVNKLKEKNSQFKLLIQQKVQIDANDKRLDNGILEKQMQDLKEKNQKLKTYYKQTKHIDKQHIEYIQKEYQQLHKSFQPGVFTEYIEFLSSKYQDLQNQYEKLKNENQLIKDQMQEQYQRLTKELELINLETLKYFGRNFDLQIFKDINDNLNKHKCDFSACLQKYQTLEFQFKQINEQLEISLQHQAYYQQICNQLSQECDKEYKMYLDCNIFNQIKRAHEKEIEKINKNSKSQLSDLEQKYQEKLHLQLKEIDELGRQIKKKNGEKLKLEVDKNEMEEKIRELEIQIENKTKQNYNSEEQRVKNLQQIIQEQKEQLQNLKIQSEKQISDLQLRLRLTEKDQDQNQTKIDTLQHEILLQKKNYLIIQEKSKKSSEELNQRLKLYEDRFLSEAQEYRQQIAQQQIQIFNFQKINLESQNQCLAKFNEGNMQQHHEIAQKIQQIEDLKQKLILQKQEQLKDIETKDYQMRQLVQSSNTKLEEHLKQIEFLNKKIEELHKENSDQSQEILSLNKIIRFIIKRFKPQELQVKYEFLSKLMFENYAQSLYIKYDPFENEQVMPQECRFNIFKLQFDQSKLKEIAINGDSPDFDDVIYVNKGQLKTMVRSIHPNKEQNYFQGYYVKRQNQLIDHFSKLSSIRIQKQQHYLINDEQEDLQLSFIRKQKQKHHPNNTELEELQAQLGHQLLLQYFMDSFNNLLTENNLDYPKFQLPTVSFAKDVDNQQYHYIEEMNELQLQGQNQSYSKYTNALKYYSYYCSKGRYMITDMCVWNNYISDAIVSSKYQILGFYDKGNEEIFKQVQEIEPENYNYENYQDLMAQFMI